MSPLRLLPLLLLLAGCGHPPDERRWKFPSDGVSTVVLRASAARAAAVGVGSGAIVVAARPVLVAAGYHSHEPGPSLTPAAQWPLDFSAERKGATLVLSARGETRFPHHRYFLNAIVLRVPRGVEVRRETPAIPH